VSQPAVWFDLDRFLTLDALKAQREALSGWVEANLVTALAAYFGIYVLTTALSLPGAVVLTLASTLFASWAWGFTLNRVSLFALIFSIGILVDDAIVVVENIHRRALIDQLPLAQVIPRAVDEVGGPTILATFTVIAALLPMAFVSGLMGPYMAPIPINSSMGMLLSLAIAFVITPWMALRLLPAAHGAPTSGDKLGTRLATFFERVMRPFLRGDAGRGYRRWLGLGIAGAIALSVLLVPLNLVVLKMLPFDNKSEFQVIVDMPTGTPVEATAALLRDLAVEVAKVPEVTDYQAYAGLAAPINFNGLVRQYYLRSGGEVGDLQVNLVDKHQRSRKSHEIAQALHPALDAIARRSGADIKVVEVRGYGAGLTISGFGQMNTPPGAIQAGRITDPKGLGTALKSLLQRSGIRTNKVIASVGGNEAVVVRVIDVPRMSPGELKEAMKYEVERSTKLPCSNSTTTAAQWS